MSHDSRKIYQALNAEINRATMTAAKPEAPKWENPETATFDAVLLVLFEEEPVKQKQFKFKSKFRKRLEHFYL